MKAYLYGKEIEDVVEYLAGDIVVVKCAGEKLNYIGMKDDVEIKE